MTEKIPQELLCDIFTYIADSQPVTRRKGYTYEESDDDTDFSPRSEGYFCPTYTLRPLTLVCKLWKQTAESLLYSSISLGDPDGKSLGQLCRLVKTLEQTPRLALIVKKLRFATMICDREESQNQAKCIALCPYVTHVSLEGYNGYVLDEFHSALAGLIYLRELKISHFNLRDAECSPFCSIDKLLTMMMGWKDMEAIMFHTPTRARNELQWHHEQVEEEPSVPSDDEEEPHDEAGVRRREDRAALIRQQRDDRQSNIPIRARMLDPIVCACPKFKRWSWDSVHLNSIQLRVLAAIAPNLQRSNELCVIHYKDPEPERLALYDALSHWGRTLTSFACIPNSGLPLVDDSLADQLVQLRELKTNRSFIGFEALGRLESLESLTFYLFNRVDDRVDELAAAVTKMTSLRVLNLRSMDVVDPGHSQMIPVLRPESLNRLITVCDSRGIALSFT